MYRHDSVTGEIIAVCDACKRKDAVGSVIVNGTQAGFYRRLCDVCVSDIQERLSNIMQGIEEYHTTNEAVNARFAAMREVVA